MLCSVNYRVVIKCHRQEKTCKTIKKNIDIFVNTVNEDVMVRFDSFYGVEFWRRWWLCRGSIFLYCFGISGTRKFMLIVNSYEPSQVLFLKTYFHQLNRAFWIVIMSWDMWHNSFDFKVNDPLHLRFLSSL